MDARDGGWAGGAGLGLEELGDGEGLKGGEAGGAVDVVGVFADGVAGVVEGDGADERGGGLAAEELSEEFSHLE